MEERYTVVVNRLKEKKTLLEYIAQRLLEKETIDKQEFDDIIKAESQLPQQPISETSKIIPISSDMSGEQEQLYKAGMSSAADSSDSSTPQQ